jgi:hypothetical protein
VVGTEKQTRLIIAALPLIRRFRGDHCLRQEKKMRKITSFVIVFILITSSLFAISLNDLRIIASDGTFLGTLENDQYSTNSIYNKYGKYGSKYNSNCILNKYDNYGSDYSNVSPFNKYASDPPGLYDRQGNFYGTLSINKYASGVTDQSYKIAIQLKAHRDSL